MRPLINRAFLLLLGICFSHALARAQDEKFEALFIYNFTKYINWPSESQTSEFVITVIGNDEVIPELESISGRMKANNKPIVVKKASSAGAIPPCQIVYVPKGKSGEIPSILENMKNKSVLVITQKANACTFGAALNFVSRGGNLSFEINRNNIEKHGLQVNSQLFTLGTVVQ